MSRSVDILILGAGVFGLTAALELRRRGHAVTVAAPGPIPHPLAASTDISKVVRMEYGVDHQYMEMVERSIPGFEEWNQELGDTVYHGDGVTMFTQQPMEPGGFEFESYRTLKARGHQPVRMQGDDIARRFPAWSGAYVDGFYHALGGYVESGRLMSGLSRLARESGVLFVDAEALAVEAGRVVFKEDSTIEAGTVVVAAGAWTPVLVPDLARYMKYTGHPVFHLKPANPAPFAVPDFVTFTADVARTGWYGFPFNPREGVVKVANHGIGVPVHPSTDERVVFGEDHDGLRAFLSLALPGLAGAEVVYTRRCLYCDTLDEHLWIDHHPEMSGVVVASGGSGHAMKFAPVLGPLVADVVEGKPHPWKARFAWRHLDALTRGQEAARHHP